MKKIPTLFVRDPENRKYVLPEVTAGCEWVLAGEGIATRKYDGTCVLIRRDGLAVKAFTRREVKPGKQPPPNFVEVEHDETTGKTVGWEPADQSGFASCVHEAIIYAPEHDNDLLPGTYELCGPKINGNPEGKPVHVLVPHDRAEVYVGAPRDFEHLHHFVMSQEAEGIVWHHPDGRMAKLKRRDFRPSSSDDAGTAR